MGGAEGHAEMAARQDGRAGGQVGGDALLRLDAEIF